MQRHRHQNDWFVTASGRRVWITEPDPEQIEITDIAHALSHICRFGGHCDPFYSVAQHSVFVSHVVPAEFAKAGLLHDATEAYLGDVIRPLKRILTRYAEIEDLWAAAIAIRFGLKDPELEGETAIKAADLTALATERRDLVIPAHEKRAEWRWVEDELGFEPDENTITALSPTDARDLFLVRWAEVR